MRYDDRRRFERNLALAVLAGGDAIPGDIERAVRSWIEHGIPRGASRGYAALRDEITSPSAISSLARFLPNVLADATRDELMIMPADENVGHGAPYRAAGGPLDLGIHDHLQHYYPPSPFKGPFLALLRLAPTVGLRLVLDLVDHATQAWVARQRAPRYGHAGSRPAPQRLALETGEQEVWGDAAVWRWYRTTAVAPSPLVCALMAFERWLSDYAASGMKDRTMDVPADMNMNDVNDVNDVKMEHIFATVMRQTHSATIIGVLASIAVKYPDRCATAVLPIMRCPAFYFMDQERKLDDRREAAQGMAEVFGALTGDTGWREIQRAAREEHRKGDLEWLAVRLMYTHPACREVLLPAIRAFPTQLPYTDESQIGDVAAEARLRQMCEFLVLRTDVEQFEAVDVGDGRFALQAKHIPEHLARAQEETEAKAGHVGELLGLQTWAMRQLAGEPPRTEGDRYDPASALAAVKRLAEAPIESQPPSESASDPPYVQEQMTTAIAAVAAALVVHHREALTDPDDVRWCRERLLEAADAVSNAPSPFEDEFTAYPWGADRSAARALPYLLAEDTDDAELRTAIAVLCVQGAREVRALTYSALAYLWSRMPTFIWACLKLGNDLSLRLLPVRRGSPPVPVLQWVNTRLRDVINGAGGGAPEALRDRKYQDVDWAILVSVVMVLPARQVALPDEWNRQLLTIYDDWLRFTIAIYEQAEPGAQQRGIYLRVPDAWTKQFFARLSGRLLLMDPAEAERRFLAPILVAWERAPEMMVKFMRALLWEARENSAKDTAIAAFVTLWKQIGTALLTADSVREGRFRYDRGVEDALALLVFGDHITRWGSDTFEPVELCADLITQWCDVVGPVTSCFRALIRLLSTIGFRLFVRHGVAWLASCLRDDDVATALLAELDIAQSLAALLVKAYRDQKSDLRSSGETWRSFNVVIDRLVTAGEPAAADLQTRIRARR